MFKVIDMLGNMHIAYGTFVDEEGDVQLILCDDNGEFYKTSVHKGFYKLCPDNVTTVCR